MNVASGNMTTIYALLDGAGNLREAESAIARLQEEAGGAADGPLAVPGLAAIARLALRLKMPISRPVEVAREDCDISMWVRALPEGEGLRISVTDWVERPPRLLDDDIAVTMRVLAASAEGWAWQIDSRMRFRTIDVEAQSVGHALPELGDLLTAYFVLTDDGLSADHPMPVIEALARRAPFYSQAARLRADPLVHYSLSAIPIFDLQGHLLGYRGSAIPAEHEERLEGELEHAARGVRAGLEPQPEAAGAPKLLGLDVSRRLDEALRKPLSRIIANASSISNQLEGPLRKDYADYAADIAAAGRHLVELVDDLADLQAIERPGFTTAREEVDLADLARRASGLLNVRAAARSITIVTPAIGEKALARAEYRRVLQILVNLIGNAVRYSPDESSIWLRVDSADGRAIAVVADQGRGIALEDQERVFDKFERLASNDSSGSGLGLYISRTLARAMGGDIIVESAPGQGARFTLDLPAWT